MVRLKHARLSLCVLLSYSVACVSAPLPLGEKPRERIGIVRASELPELERISHRVRQWLEAIEGLDADVEVSASPLQSQRLRLLLQREQLGVLADKGTRAILEGGAAFDGLKATESEISLLQQKLSTFRGFSPERLNAFLFQALFALKQADEVSMIRAIEKARALSVGVEPDWFSKYDPEEAHPWLSHMLQVWRKGRQSATCLVEIKTSPDAAVAINGFPVALEGPVKLTGGSSYDISTSAVGYKTELTTVHCPARHTQRQVRIVLKRGPSGPVAAHELAQIASALSLKTLVLLDKSDAAVKLYLFTPPKSLDVIPISSLALQNWESAGAPSHSVASDAFLDLYRRHLTSASLAIDPVPSAPNSLSLRETAEGSAGWYNDWKFWAIAGGVAGAVLATVLLTRGEPISNRPSNLKIQFQ